MNFVKIKRGSENKKTGVAMVYLIENVTVQWKKKLFQ